MKLELSEHSVGGEILEYKALLRDSTGRALITTLVARSRASDKSLFKRCVALFKALKGDPPELQAWSVIRSITWRLDAFTLAALDLPPYPFSAPEHTQILWLRQLLTTVLERSHPPENQARL